MNVDLTNLQVALIVVLAVWEVVWKGFALWRAAHHSQPYWFGVLLVLNTAGVLPILYLLTAQNKKS